jgi:hypothetical protein
MRQILKASGIDKPTADQIESRRLAVVAKRRRREINKCVLGFLNVNTTTNVDRVSNREATKG